MKHLEAKLEKSIETSANGLSNHFVSGNTVPILCIDEHIRF